MCVVCKQTDGAVILWEHGNVNKSGHHVPNISIPLSFCMQSNMYKHG